MIEIKRWDNGEIIHKGDFTSIKECLEHGVREEVSFHHADLSNADLSNAKLDCAELEGADLKNANLNSAELNDAELNYVDLSNADLSNAELRNTKLHNTKFNNANLKNVKLNNAVGNSTHVQCFQFADYKIVIHGDTCHYDCITKSLQEWLNYEGDELNSRRKKYLNDFTKPLIRMVINSRKSR